MRIKHRDRIYARNSASNRKDTLGPYHYGGDSQDRVWCRTPQSWCLMEDAKSLFAVVSTGQEQDAICSPRTTVGSKKKDWDPRLVGRTQLGTAYSQIRKRDGGKWAIDIWYIHLEKDGGRFVVRAVSPHFQRRENCTCLFISVQYLYTGQTASGVACNVCTLCTILL